MQIKGIRHNRIIELRGMALCGMKLSELEAKCIKWGILKGTINSYIDEVRVSLNKAMKK